MPALPKKLALSVGNLGGGDHFFAKNVKRSGDYASVASIGGNYRTGTEILISPYHEFDTPEYIKQMKDFILSVNPDATFANDQKNSSFVDVSELLKIIESKYKLMSFELESIKKNNERLHRLYLEVKGQGEKVHLLPRHHDYEANHSDYPLIQVFSGLNTLIYG